MAKAFGFYDKDKGKAKGKAEPKEFAPPVKKDRKKPPKEPPKPPPAATLVCLGADFDGALVRREQLAQILDLRISEGGTAEAPKWSVTVRFAVPGGGGTYVAATDGREAALAVLARLVLLLQDYGIAIERLPVPPPPSSPPTPPAAPAEPTPPDEEEAHAAAQ